MNLNKKELYLIIIPLLIILVIAIVDLVFTILVHYENCGLRKFTYFNKFNVNNQDEVLVNTKYGQIKGKQLFSMYKQVPYYSFRGIPYAKPPTSQLRFLVSHIRTLISLNFNNF